MVEIGKIRKVPLRELWEKEDKNFTVWLSKNIEHLNEKLDFDISVDNAEERAGPFKVDLVGTDDINNRKIIIENQLEKTDHTHLGQIITYLVNLEAKIAIWITSKPVQEHIRAIDWLNENSPSDVAFYLIKVEAIRIEPNEISAPLFTIVTGPTEEAKEIGQEKKEYAQRHILRKEFWTKLLEKAKTKTKLYDNISPSIYSWIGTGAGKSGISYNFVISNRYARCEIYMDAGKDSEEINKARFDKLRENKEEIEKKLGKQLRWERLENRRASRISFEFEEGSLKNKDTWDEVQEKMINIMIKIESVFRDHIKNLN